MGVKISIRPGAARSRVIIVVMGVTGCGKTTLGQLLAHKLNLPFYDADDFHPEGNREKLRANIPLDDPDRLPWLKILAGRIGEWEQSGGAVLACSALKQKYRDILSSGTQHVQFVHLAGPKDMIARRLAQRAREGHTLIRDFDKILDGQYRDLEPPKNAISIPVELPMDEAVDQVLTQINAHS